MSLKLKNISHSFKDGKTKKLIINNLSIYFPRYGLVGIIGKSGCGKTTLLNIIAGILKPDEGKVIIDKFDIYNTENEDIVKNNYLSYIYQDSNLIPWLNIHDNLKLFCQIKGTTINNYKLNKYINFLKISDTLTKYPSQLSGGQKQRISIVRSLICDCPILLCDEPTSALNEDLAYLVGKLLREYSRNHLVIVVSHNNELIRRYSDKIIDFNQILTNYNFNNSYLSRYLFQLNNPVKKLKGLIFKQLIYQRNKLSIMFLSQIINLILIILMILAIAGFKEQVDKYLLGDPSLNVIEISDKKEKEVDLIFLKNHQRNKLKEISYNYNLDLGLIKNKTDTESFISQYCNRNLDINEIIVSRELANKYKLKINSKLTYIYDNKEYYFSIVDIYQGINNYLMIYFNHKSLPQELKNKLLDKYQVNVVLKDINLHKAYLNNLNDKFQGYSNYLTYNETYGSLVQMLFAVLIFFIFLSLLVSSFIIILIFKSIINQVKRIYILLIINGLYKKELYKIIISQTMACGLIILICSYIFCFAFVEIFNYLNLSQLFQLPFVLSINPSLFKGNLYIYLFLLNSSYYVLLGLYLTIKLLKSDKIATLKGG